MATVMATTGLQYFAALAVNKDTPENLVIKLGKNDLTPDADSVAGDFTEATFTGYAELVTDPADWTVTVTDVAGVDRAVATHPAVEFVSTASAQDEAIYTSYIVTETSNILIASDRFTAPQIARHIVNTGDKKVATATISFIPA